MIRPDPFIRTYPFNSCQTLAFIILLPFVTPLSSTCRQVLYRLSLFCQILRHSLQSPPFNIDRKQSHLALAIPGRPVIPLTIGRARTVLINIE